MANRNMTSSKSALPKVQSSQCPPLPLKATRMVRRIQTPFPMPKSSQANTPIGPSKAASGIIYPRKLRRPLLTPSSKSAFRKTTNIMKTRMNRNRINRNDVMKSTDGKTEMYETENDLPKAARVELVGILNQRLADCIDL